MNQDLELLLIALLLAGAGAITDLWQRRIPNWLTYPGILAGGFLQSVFFGWRGLLTALAGCALAGGAMLVLYVIRAMGGGDVKLLAAIGSVVGPQKVLVILLATAIMGGVLAILVALFRGRSLATLKNLLCLMRFHAVRGLEVHPEHNLENPSAMRLPYGLAIAGGTLYALVIYLRR